MSARLSALLEEIRLARQHCRILNADLLSLTAKKTRETAKLQILKSDNAALSGKIEELKDITESCKRYDFDALRKEVETLEASLADHIRAEDRLMLDIDRLNIAVAVQKESQQREDLYCQVNGTAPGHSTDHKLCPENYFVALHRGLERDLEVLERKESRPRTIARKRSQVKQAEALCG
jgi:hypothetical protein